MNGWKQPARWRAPLCRFLWVIALGFSAAPARGQTIDILAAASTTEAVTAVAAALKRDTGIRLRPTFAASSTLAKQIAAGAPAHLFLSANLAWMKYLRDARLLAPGGTVDLLGNRLVLLGRKGETGLAKLADLNKALGAARLIMGDPTHVPAGRYGRQALQRLHLWKAVKPKAVFGASVRDALAILARGQGRFAVAYETDARVFSDLSIAAIFPDASHEPITYPLAIINDQDSALVRKIFGYFQGPAAKSIFEQYGFTFLPRPP